MRTYRESPIIITSVILLEQPSWLLLRIRTEFKGSAIMTGYGDSGRFLQIEIDYRLGHDMVF